VEFDICLKGRGEQVLHEGPQPNEMRRESLPPAGDVGLVRERKGARGVRGRPALHLRGANLGQKVLK